MSEVNALILGPLLTGLILLLIEYFVVLPSREKRSREDKEIKQPQKVAKPPSKSSDYLLAEYSYISDTAANANRRRDQLAFWYYAVASIELIIFIIISQVVELKLTEAVYRIFFAFSLVFSISCTLAIIRLARLRAAWHESMLAMNQIKEYVISKDKDIEKAFRWRMSTSPPKYKRNNLSFEASFIIALIGGLNMGIALFSLEISIRTTNYFDVISAIILGVICLLLNLYLYRRLLIFANE